MFGFSFDRRTLRIIMIALLLMGGIGILTNTSKLMRLLLSAPGVLLAITFHEFAHGVVAYKLGDNTAKSQGRLTLNPLAHLDPIGCIMLLVAGFGWGKPVTVNPRNYTRKISMEKGEAIVALAGPVMNFILAFILSIILMLIGKFAGVFTLTQIGSIICSIIYSAVVINIGLGAFNLLPLPPLDGSIVIKPFLPRNAKYWFENNEHIFYIIFILLWITGLAGSIITPVIQVVYNVIINLAGLIVGV